MSTHNMYYYKDIKSIPRTIGIWVMDVFFYSFFFFFIFFFFFFFIFFFFFFFLIKTEIYEIVPSG